MHIRLQYLYFEDAKFCTDTIGDICNLGSFAISWIYEIVTKSSAEAEFIGDPLERLDTDSYLCPLSRAG